MHRWQLQEAKARFSELIKTAQTEGPQEISVRGEAAAVVLSMADYNKLVHPKPGFVSFLRNSPLAEVSLDLERDKSPARDFEL
jgi:antitoxin Phd